MFSYEFCKISHGTFFKEPCYRLLLYKHSFFLLPHHKLSPFQKRCHTHCAADYFLGLICRLRTRVNLILQTLSLESLSTFVKKVPLQMFDRALNTSLWIATKMCSKVKNQNLRNKFLKLLLFIDSVFTETATSFLIPNFHNDIFVFRSSPLIKCF